MFRSLAFKVPQLPCFARTFWKRLWGRLLSGKITPTILKIKVYFHRRDTDGWRIIHSGWQSGAQLSGGADMENGRTGELAEGNRPRLAGRDKTRQHTDKQRRGHKERGESTEGDGAWVGKGAPRGRGGGLPSFSSVWWSLDGFLLPDLHLPSRLKKFSSSSRPYSGPAAPPSDSFTALVNFTWDTRTRSLSQSHGRNLEFSCQAEVSDRRLTFELWRMKESRSTELISSRSSTPSVSPEREERFSQFPGDTRELKKGTWTTDTTEQQGRSEATNVQLHTGLWRQVHMRTQGLGRGSIPSSLLCGHIRSGRLHSQRFTDWGFIQKWY